MISDLIFRRCEWGEATTLLDFGCGQHGNIATALCQYTTHTVAVDANVAAVEAFNEWCGLQGLESSEVCALTTNEFANLSQFLNYFDIVAACLVFHHIEEPARVEIAAMLRRRLRSSGKLVLVDVLKQGDDDTINGFTVQDLRTLLLDAGFSDVSVELGPRITLHSQRRTRILIATAS